MDISDLIRPAVLGLPPYVPGKPIEEVERELGIKGAVKMASNENPLGPAPEVVEAIAAAAHKAALYPDANAFYLRRALSEHLGIGSECILTGNGLDDVLRIIAETFFRPGDEVVVPDPAFSVYASVSLLVEAKPVRVRGRKGLGNDLDAMRDAVTDRTKAVFVCNPNNPTGTFVGRVEFRDFLDSIPPRILVVLDEAYADFADEPDFPRGIDLVKEGGRRLVVLKTYSKIHGMAALRLGYAVADEAIISAMHKARDPFNVNSLAQAAGVVALGCRDHVDRYKKLVQNGRRYFYAALDELGIDYLPTQANFILIDLKRDSRPMYEFLLRKGLIVRPTHSFGLPTCLRISFGLPEQNERFFTLLKEGLAAGY